MTLQERIAAVLCRHSGRHDSLSDYEAAAEILALFSEQQAIVRSMAEALEGILPGGGMHYDHVRKALALYNDLMKENV